MNSNLEKAIQEAMAELDRMAELDQIPTTTTSPVAQSKKISIAATPVTSKVGRTRVTRASTAQQRTKLIKIAPAPPNNKKDLITCMMEPPR